MSRKLHVWLAQAYPQVDTNGHTEEFEYDGCFGVTLRQIVKPFKSPHERLLPDSVQVGWQRCGQRLTFTSTHFGDTAIAC